MVKKVVKKEKIVEAAPKNIIPAPVVEKEEEDHDDDHGDGDDSADW